MRPELILCINCFELNSFGSRVCAHCCQSIELNEHLDLLNEVGRITLFGFQNRETIQAFMDRASPGDPIPKASHLPYNEVINFIVLSIISGLTFEATKFVAIKIYQSLKRQNISIQNQKYGTSGHNPDQKLLEELINDRERLHKLIEDIKDYMNDMPGAPEPILDETEFVNKEVIHTNKELLDTLSQNVKLKMREEG